MNDYEYLMKFSKITIPKACKKVKVTYQNLHKGTTSKEKIKAVREEIENELARLYIKEENKDVK